MAIIRITIINLITMILMEDLNLIPIALWVCSITGALFIVYAFAAFINHAIDNSFRLSLSFIFLLTGFLFFSSVGSILTGQTVTFTILSLIIAVMLAIVGLLFTYTIYHQSKTLNSEL